MANLLPTTERKALAIERRWRLVSAISVLFSIVGLAGIGLLTPSFIAARSTLASGAERIATTQQLIERQGDGGTWQSVGSINEIITHIKTDDGNKPSESIAQIIDVLPAGVALHSITWKQGDATDTLDIAGVAATRTALIAFGDGLKTTGRFTDVTIPINSLAAQTDLQFRLTLVLNK